MQEGEDSGSRSSGTLSSGTLYVVATPIGNLEDISRRAVNVLAAVALIAAEDTRRTRSLLAALDVKPPQLIALHDHNEADLSARIADRLADGEDVALVSDAGTPLLADPGYPLLGECFRRGINVRPVPGASALVSALSVCPLPTADFCFLGFLPSKAAARRSRLETYLGRGPVIFFEAPHRIAACLSDLAEHFSQRRVFLGREMTKKFESYLCGLPHELLAMLQETGGLRGEFVVVVEGPEQNAEVVALTATETMQVLARHLPPAQAARIGAELLGLPRRELYRLSGRSGDETPES